MRVRGTRSETGRGAKRFVALTAALAVLALLVGVAPAFARPAFDPNTILSDSQLRDAGSMSAADVQAFLDRQPGVLKSLVTPDHTGVPKRASAIIWEASSAHGINPKVMLVLLQKEQSLITRTTVTQRTLERAVGAGCPDGVRNRYPGFGPQVWNGARLLDAYGEGKSATYIPTWMPGMTREVGGSEVIPTNIATFKLYVYNPVIGAKAPYGDLAAQAGQLSGNANFWHIYWEWFGDPLAGAKPTESATTSLDDFTILPAELATPTFRIVELENASPYVPKVESGRSAAVLDAATADPYSSFAAFRMHRLARASSAAIATGTP